MEWTGVGSLRKRKEATDLAVAAGGVVDQVGLVMLHKKPRRVNEGRRTAAREEVEEEGDGTESVTTVMSSTPASARIDAPSPPLLQRPPAPPPEADAAIDQGGAGEVVEELTTVADLVKKGGSGLLVRRPALGHRLAVFWRRDRPFVLNDACPHRGAPLSEGDLEDLVVDEEDEDEEAEAGTCPARRGGEKVVTHVVCPLHYYKYDLASGRCHEGGDWSESLKVYEAWVEGDRVMAKLPRLPPISDDDDNDSADDDEER